MIRLLVACNMGLAVTVVWVPHTPAQTTALLALFAPWAALVVRVRSGVPRPEHASTHLELEVVRVGVRSG